MSGNCYYCGSHPDEIADSRKRRDELETEIERLRGQLVKEQAFHDWLRRFLDKCQGRDELTAKEANTIRNTLNETENKPALIDENKP